LSSLTIKITSFTEHQSHKWKRTQVVHPKNYSKKKWGNYSQTSPRNFDSTENVRFHCTTMNIPT